MSTALVGQELKEKRGSEIIDKNCQGNLKYQSSLLR
jgi:hypothetical protein